MSDPIVKNEELTPFIEELISNPSSDAEYEKLKVELTRLAGYQRQADPLYFGWQRGDNTEQEWLDAVQAVKDANPYPVTGV